MTNHSDNNKAIMPYFEYAHLPQPLARTSSVFHTLALHLEKTLPDSREKTKALDKLLESKDAAVRAMLGQPTKQ